jgi:hypothetical protein
MIQSCNRFSRRSTFCPHRILSDSGVVSHSPFVDDKIFPNVPLLAAFSTILP